MDDIRGRITFTDAGATATLDKVAKGAKNVGDASKNAGTNVGQFGSTVGLAGAAIGQLNGGLGRTVSVVGSALGSIQAMTTAGMGPLGLAVAGLSVALTAANALYTIYKERTDAATQAMRDATDATDANTLSLKKNLEEIDRIIARRREADQTATRSANLSLGGGTVEEQSALVEQRRRQLQTARDAERGIGTPFDSGRSIEAQRAQRATDREVAERLLRSAQTMLTEARDRDERGAQHSTPQANSSLTEPPRTRRAGSRPEDNTDASDTALRQKQIDAALARQAEADALQEANKNGTRGGLRIIGGPGKDGEGDGFQRGMELDRTLLESQVEREKAASESLKDIYKDTFGTLQAGIAASADAMINGGASAEQAGLMIVAALANQLSKVAMMKGLEEAALAAGSFASYDYPGAAMHLAAAGAWTLVGAAAGVAGGALSAAAKPSGASGPSTGAGPAPRQQAAESERAMNLTVNFAGGVITAATEAQLARTIRRTVSNSALGAT